MYIDTKHIYKRDRIDLKIEDVNEKIIFESIKEFYHYLNESDFSFSKNQKLFWGKVTNHKTYKNFHGWKHPKSNMSDLWLNSQPKYFFSKKISKEKLAILDSI